MTVEQPVARQGIEAAQFLPERMRGEQRRSRTSILECRLVVRQSTDPSSHAATCWASSQAPASSQIPDWQQHPASAPLSSRRIRIATVL
ncbi:hypothetical protein [Edaphobacter aggregans]|uniref:hypothetical protein n=1 Tax=Edaphobacter aggregans TaxID=570835 RepID=UPI003CCC2D42